MPCELQVFVLNVAAETSLRTETGLLRWKGISAFEILYFVIIILEFLYVEVTLLLIIDNNRWQVNRPLKEIMTVFMFCIFIEPTNDLLPRRGLLPL